MSGSSDTPSAPVPLKTFIASLRPQKIGTRTVTPRRGQTVGQQQTIDVYGPGSPNEIWARYLQIQHGNERRPMEGWQKLVDEYGKQPAHPADPRYAG